jgi:glyoxylase-like metal-dependent hydrolase (beta-lactamase superfamily II)
MARTIALAAGILSLTSPHAAGADVVRTADIKVRGLSVSDFPRMIKLADNVYAYEVIQPAHLRMGGFATNAFIVVTNDGVLVADGFGSEDLVKGMVAAIGKITSQPIRYVVAASDHGDHRGGDRAFPADAKFFASAASKAVLDAEAKAPGRPPASRTIVYNALDSDKTTLRAGTTEIQILNLGRAHTGGDLEVYLPRENILFMSEVFLCRMFPSMHTAYPSEWAEALRKAEAMHAQNYIPGHGFVDTPEVMREELVNYRKCMEYVVAEGKRLHDAKVPVEDAAYRSDLGEYAYWTRAAQNAHDAFQRIYMEADGKLK